MAKIEQSTILDLSRDIKEKLRTKAFKKSPAVIARLKREKKSAMASNRKIGYAKRRINKENKRPSITKEELEANEERIRNLELQYQDPKVLQNEINMKSGKDFDFLINLGDTVKIEETWGKKRSIFRVNSKNFRKKDVGEVELTLLRRWKSAITKGIKEEENENVQKGLTKLLSPVQKNIEVLTGEREEEEIFEEIEDDEEYPIYVDMAGENINIFISGARK